MEKKVTGIDLDELRKAREEMYRDMGIETPSSNSGSSFSSDESLESNIVEMQHSDEYINQENNNINENQTIEINYKDDFPEDETLSDDEELLELIETFITNVDEFESDLSDELNVTNNVSKGIGEAQGSNNTKASVYARNLSHYDAFAPYEINPPIPKSEETLKEEELAAQNDSLMTKQFQTSQDEDHDLINTQSSDDHYMNFNEVKTESEVAEIEITDINSSLHEAIEEMSLSEQLTADENIISKVEGFDFEDISETNEIKEEVVEIAEAIEADETKLEINQPEIENESQNEINQESFDNNVPEEKQSSNVNIVVNVPEDLKGINNVKIEEKDNTFINIIKELEDDTVNDDKLEDGQDDIDFEFGLVENEKPVSSKIKEELPILDNFDENFKISKDDDDMFNELLKTKSSELKERTKNAEQSIRNKVEIFAEIEPINFVNVLSMQDFKASDNFTFVLGRSETGRIVYENLKQSYNIAFFANENSYELLNTMILSFMLKNSASDFKLALCDGENKHNFNYYEDSKYLYADIAKDEDAVSEMLSKIVSELESRYRTLARFNVRSIDEYNIVAKNTNTPKLSQILIVIDGYYELMMSSNFERIKSSLYQILRLGRIAGIFAIIVTNKKIEEDIINFNLPSRIGFKCNEIDDSIAMIGEMGVEKLSNKNEFLYSSIHNEKAQHLRQPMISDAIIKILIANIEK